MPCRIIWAMYGQATKIPGVPNPENFTPIRSIRIAAATWNVAKEKAREQGKSMSELVRELLDWWLRTPGAKLPKRPTVDGGSKETGATPER